MNTMTRNRSGATTRGQMAATTTASTGSYVMATGLHGESKTIVRTPHAHDVLCGRGGGINSHPGNKTFREWVKERKNEYNLASSKTEKARVSKEIVDRIRNLSPPGRFLTRDPDGIGIGGTQTSWIEIEEEKAMQKTSQALREGAPKIRAEHAQEITLTRTSQPPSSEPEPIPAPVMKSQAPVIARTGRPQSLSPASAAAVKALKRNAEAAKRAAEEEERKMKERKRRMPPPLMPNAKFERTFLRPAKLAKHERDSRAVDPRLAPTPPPEDTETPPLKPVPAVKPVWPPASAFAMPQAAMNIRTPMGKIPRADRLARANSLALSDIDHDEKCLQDPFVNPFEDECVSEAKKARLSRTLTASSSSSHGDLGGIGALMNESKADVRVSTNGLGSKATIQKINGRSLSTSSNLSDLPDVCYRPSDFTDFDEGMKTVFDAAHPGLTSTLNDDVIPTHLYPFKGNKKIRRRRSSKFPSPGSISSLISWDSPQ